MTDRASDGPTAEPAAPTVDSGQSGSKNGLLLVVVLLAAFAASMFDSPSLSLTELILARLTSSFTSLSQVQSFDWSVWTVLQLGVLALTVAVFYLIGKKADFAARSLRYAAVVFAGALIGDAVSYYMLAQPNTYETGFGYVWSFGIGDPSSFLTILAAAVGSFMIPVAGLGLSSLRQGRTGGTVQPDAGPRRLSPRAFFAAGFVIAALALPVSAAVFQALGYQSTGSGLIIEGFDPWRSLISGYSGFLVYPVLLITTFYFLGKGRSLVWKDVPCFGVWMFVAGAAGLLAGIMLSVSIQEPGGVARVFSQSNLPGLSSTLIVDGLLFTVVGLASASLGVFGRATAAPRTRSNLLPVGLSVLLVVMVVVAGMASYAYALSPYLGESKYTCAYQPGAALYLKVVSDQSQSPVSGLPATGELQSLCPVITECTGQGPCQSAPMTIRTLGAWSFVTNSTGYVSVPSQMLGGSGFWFDLTYQGHGYQARLPVCGGGTTFAQLDLPSGAISGREIPANNGSVVSSVIGQNGTQFTSGCGATTFSSSATKS